MILFTEGSADHENEDAVLVEPSVSHPECWIGAIADGQGGRYGGAKAARLACQTIVNAAHELPPNSLNRPNVWRELFRISDHAVSTDSEAGFTTLVALCVFKAYAILCQHSAPGMEMENLLHVQSLRDLVMPNRLIVEFADRILNWNLPSTLTHHSILSP